MARIDLARRAEIGREKRARTRAQIVEAGSQLLAERPLEGLTIDAVVEAAGVAKGTFYYHFQSIGELAAAVGDTLAKTFDDLLAPARLSMPDPLARISFAFTEFLSKAIADPVWTRLVIRSAEAPSEFFGSVRANVKGDLAEAKAQGRVALDDIDLAADIGLGILVGVMRGTLHRVAPPDLIPLALRAGLRAIGAPEPETGAGSVTGTLRGPD